jgi:hypothetical protein
MFRPERGCRAFWSEEMADVQLNRLEGRQGDTDILEIIYLGEKSDIIL